MGHHVTIYIYTFIAYLLLILNKEDIHMTSFYIYLIAM